MTWWKGGGGRIVRCIWFLHGDFRPHGLGWKKKQNLFSRPFWPHCLLGPVGLVNLFVLICYTSNSSLYTVPLFQDVVIGETKILNILGPPSPTPSLSPTTRHVKPLNTNGGAQSRTAAGRILSYRHRPAAPPRPSGTTKGRGITSSFLSFGRKGYKYISLYRIAFPIRFFFYSPPCTPSASQGAGQTRLPILFLFPSIPRQQNCPGIQSTASICT